MNCQICNKESKDKYCDECKHIRCVYTIHKLSEKISLNEKFNTNTLIIKKLKNIERYDLELLTDNGILTRDRLNNYQWAGIESINQYLDKYDKSDKKITIKEDKKDAIPSLDKVVLFLEKNYNITDTFDIDKLSAQLNTSKNQTKKIIEKLAAQNLIKKSFYGNYKLNYHQIIKYKQSQNIQEDKIKTLSGIKETSQDKKSTTTITGKKSSTKSKKTTKKTGNKKSTKKVDDKKKTRQKNRSDSKDNVISMVELSKENNLVPTIRDFINSQLIILPHNITDNDLTLDELYSEFKDYTSNDIRREDFDKYFHRIINTYPHIRHKNLNDTVKYNIKSRKTPWIIMDNLQKNNQKFRYNSHSRVRLKDNTLEVDAYIHGDELAQLYNLIIYTQENITDYRYSLNDDMIHVEITYDLTDENPDLWLKFLKSYNL